MEKRAIMTITAGVIALATATAVPLAAAAGNNGNNGNNGGNTGAATIVTAPAGNRQLASTLLAGLRVESNLYQQSHGDSKYSDYKTKGTQKFDDTMDPGTATSVGGEGRIPYLPQNDVFYNAYAWSSDGFHENEDLWNEKDNVGVTSDFGVGIIERDLTDYTHYVYQGQHKFDSGTLHDPFNSNRTEFYKDDSHTSFEIVQVVSNLQAWQGGAVHWTQEQRHQFYTDPLNYITVSGHSTEILTNSWNSHHDYRETVDKWLPGTGGKADWESGNSDETISNPGYDCAWVARQIAVKAKYHLAISPEEKTTMQRTLSSCPTMTAPNDTDGEWWFNTKLDAKESQPETRPQTVTTTVDEAWSTGRNDNQACNRATAPDHTCVVNGVTIDAEYAMAKAGIQSAHLTPDQVKQNTEQHEQAAAQQRADRHAWVEEMKAESNRKNLAEAKPTKDGKTTIWYKPSNSKWTTVYVSSTVANAPNVPSVSKVSEMTRTDDGWFKATIDNPHGLRVTLMFAPREDYPFWDMGKTGLGYEAVAQDGNLTVQNNDITDHAPQQ